MRTLNSSKSLHCAREHTRAVQTANGVSTKAYRPTLEHLIYMHVTHLDDSGTTRNEICANKNSSGDDSERELFLRDIVHVEASAYAH